MSSCPLKMSRVPLESKSRALSFRITDWVDIPALSRLMPQKKVNFGHPEPIRHVILVTRIHRHQYIFDFGAGFGMSSNCTTVDESLDPLR